MEIGKRLGIQPGTPYPGKTEAIRIIESAKADPSKGSFVNLYNYKNKPKRMWNAITGKYFGLIPITAITYNTLKNDTE